MCDAEKASVSLGPFKSTVSDANAENTKMLLAILAGKRRYESWQRGVRVPEDSRHTIFETENHRGCVARRATQLRWIHQYVPRQPDYHQVCMEWYDFRLIKTVITVSSTFRNARALKYMRHRGYTGYVTARNERERQRDTEGMKRERERESEG